MRSKRPNGPSSPRLRQTRKGASGFTLLEVIVAISLTAGVLLVLMIGIRLSANALHVGDRQLAKLDRSISIVQVFDQQVAAAVPRVIEMKVNEKPGEYLCFRGDSLGVRFLTRASLVSNLNYGLWLATYQVVETQDGQQQLLASEEPALDIPQLRTALLTNGLAPGRTEALGDPARRIVLSYLRPPTLDKPSAWVDAWPMDEKQLPLGIRVQVWREAYAGALTFAIPVQKAVTQ